jgi:hypothetical protein
MSAQELLAEIQKLPLEEQRELLEALKRNVGQPAEAAHPLTELLGLATDMGVTDLAANHDRYAHGKLGECDDTAR